MSSAPLIVLPISSISHVIPGFPCNHITVFVLVLYLPIQIVVGSYRAIVIWRCPDHGLSNTAFLPDSEPVRLDMVRDIRVLKVSRFCPARHFPTEGDELGAAAWPARMSNNSLI